MEVVDEEEEKAEEEAVVEEEASHSVPAVFGAVRARARQCGGEGRLLSWTAI